MEHFLAILSGGGVTLITVALFLMIGDVAAAYLSPRQHQRLRSLLFILTGVAVMLVPVYVNGGIPLDQRAAIIAVVALFTGGPVLLTTGAAMLAARWFLGGGGMLAGMLCIVTTMAACAVLAGWWRRHHGKRTPNGALILAAGVAAGICSSIVLLLVQENGWALFLRNGPDLFLVQVVATCMFGFLLKLQVDRQQGAMELKQKNQDLHAALLQAVSTLSVAMSYRDPSLARHETRVADLAEAIGVEFGLGEERLEGLKLAALVHDIGNLQLPAEILMRPRKLTEEEFELVRQHAESGYQILKDVRCPWPLAEIVRQHHEDVNGCGYPRGLTGEQIMLEARILRVADSMEAMLSHQPFRRAYDLDYAIASLEEAKDTRYDPEIVDACVRLFRSGQFAFESTMKAA